MDTTIAINTSRELSVDALNAVSAGGRFCTNIAGYIAQVVTAAANQEKCCGNGLLQTPAVGGA